MVEINTFPYRGLNIEVSSGDAVEYAHVKYTEDNINKQFLIESVSTNKSAKQISTLYYKYLKDIDDNLLNTDIRNTDIYFPPNNYPTYPEVFDGATLSLGQKIDQIGINTVLYKLFGVHCYDLINNTFTPPITADAISTPCTYTVITPEPDPDPNVPPESPEYISNMDGTIAVTPVDFIGVLSYTLVQLQQTNSTGLFEGLDAGVYTVYITSDTDELPYTIIVEVLGI